MTQMLKCISPVDGSVYVERPLASEKEAFAALTEAQRAQRAWRETPIAERGAILTKAVDWFVANKAQIGEEISWQMGRPVQQSPGEIGGLEERARHMIAIAEQSLGDVAVAPKDGFTRYIRRDPLGVVFIIAPWNFPFLTAVNGVIPALMAGNAVLLKHSAQTPLAAERFADAFAAAGLPDGLFQALHLGHAAALKLVEGDGEVGPDFVNFTGSVDAGRAIQQAAAKRFIGVGLELGGKDPAYVRADVDVGHAVENVLDGAFFNSGQSCCGIERIYVDAAVYDEFVDRAAAFASAYVLDNPIEGKATIGPMVKPSAADFVREQISESLGKGARALVDESAFPLSKPGSAYLAPQLVVDLDHGHRLMTEESFGPVAGIMKVSGDDEAVRLMNDSDFGLTASVWTRDATAAAQIGDQIETGTWFMNRCDYLDPALAWTGVKHSGRGCTLSEVGYAALTRPKSFHLRTAI